MSEPMTVAALLSVTWLALAAFAAAAAAPSETVSNRRSVADRIRGREVAASLPPLDKPEVRRATSATHMRDDDLVFGVVVAGRARAYPWWVLKNYHVVNDEAAGVPLAVAFCEQCTGAAAFRRELGGRVLSFEVPGVYNGTIILQDRETRTLWAPFSGKALEGRLTGRRLDRLPISLVRWDEWKRQHPATEVVWQSAERREGHGSWYEPGKWGIVSEMGATLESWDARLPENALVYGAELRGRAKTYPLARLATHGGVVNDDIAGVPVVLAARGAFTVAGYERGLNGRILTFDASVGPEGVMVDHETGSLWSAAGEAMTGPLRGQRLKGLDGYLVEWHVWSAYNPAAELFDAASLDAGEASRHVVPRLVLQRLDGPAEALHLTAEVNLLAVWAPWCAPCGEEMPRLQALVREYGERGLSAIGMAVLIPEEFEVDEVRAFAARTGITFPTFLVDEESYAQIESLARDTGGPGLTLPTVFAADKRGRILAVFRGSRVDSLQAAVEEWLPARR